MSQTASLDPMNESEAQTGPVQNNRSSITPISRQRRRARSTRTNPNQPSLTPRQSEVLLLLEQGVHIDEIAVTLCVEVLTVRSHLRDIHRKLAVSKWQDAVYEARRQSLLPDAHAVRVAPHGRQQKNT